MDEALDRKQEYENLKRKIIQKYPIRYSDIQDFRIFRKSVDARKEVHFLYHIDLQLKNESYILSKNIKNISESTQREYPTVKMGELELRHPPVIIGFGPSGIFAALTLARRGYKPIVLEQGFDVDTRTRMWNDFLKTRTFDASGSILFGEGGAGTFSDGKLTTLVNDLRSNEILKTFVYAGADQEILYINKPHIGTDQLTGVVTNIRKEIISLGGDIRFGSKVTDIISEDNHIKAVVINQDQVLETEVLLMGVGHSARDTFQLLYDRQVTLQQKPFSMGVRIEHPQKLINRSQYGKYDAHPALGAADYKLSYHAPSGRSAYTFCMCPGGFVVASISEPGTVVTNGMSLHKRDNVNANSALLVNVTPSDFPSDHPLAGVELQRQIETKAFELAGKNYNAPIQLVGDFLNDRLSHQLGKVKSTYQPGHTFVRMSDLLPDFITKTLKEAILNFDQKIKGFALSDAVLTGPETRSSSPLRIVRDEGHEASIQGLYPMGEGAGYAGGIMSSAIDGMKTAEQIIMKYHNGRKNK